MPPQPLHEQPSHPQDGVLAFRFRYIRRPNQAAAATTTAMVTAVSHMWTSRRGLTPARLS